MTIELMVLALGCLWAAVHIFAAIHVKTRQYGGRWNRGARDEELPAPLPVVGRLARAQANYFETFPILIAAVLIVTVTNGEDALSRAGATLWLVARMVYLPLYWAGIPNVRTLVWLASILGLAMLLIAAFV